MLYKFFNICGCGRSNRHNCGNSDNRHNCGSFDNRHDCGSSDNRHDCGSFDNRHDCGNSDNRHDCGSFDNRHNCGSFDNRHDCGNSDNRHDCGNSDNRHDCGSFDNRHDCGSFDNRHDCGNSDNRHDCGSFGNRHNCGSFDNRHDCGNFDNRHDCGKENGRCKFINVCNCHCHSEERPRLSCFIEAVGKTQTVGTQSDITFDVTELDVAGRDIEVNAEGTVFTINRAGLYHVEWSLSLTNGSQPILVGLEENGAPASAMSHNSNSGRVCSGALINVTREDLPYTVSLRNFGETIFLEDPDNFENTVASIRILRFADGAN